MMSAKPGTVSLCSVFCSCKYCRHVQFSAALVCVQVCETKAIKAKEPSQMSPESTQFVIGHREICLEIEPTAPTARWDWTPLNCRQQMSSSDLITFGFISAVPEKCVFTTFLFHLQLR